MGRPWWYPVVGAPAAPPQVNDAYPCGWSLGRARAGALSRATPCLEEKMRVRDVLLDDGRARRATGR